MPRTPASALPLSRDMQDRNRELARLVGLWPAEIADVSPQGRARLIKKLELALKAERRRGWAGHWTYDLARHSALAGLLRRERAAFAALQRKVGATHKNATHPQKENAPTEGSARSLSQKSGIRTVYDRPSGR